MPHKNRRLDLNTIYREWPAAYTLYIHQNLNECIQFICVSKQTAITFTCIE